MGFEADQVIKALSMSNNNVEQVFGDRSGVFHLPQSKITLCTGCKSHSQWSAIR